MDIIEFIDRSNGISAKRRAVPIGYYLAVAYSNPSKTCDTYTVFNKLLGKPVLNVKFANLNDAIEFAKFLERVFGEWFWAWEIDPAFDVFSVCKWQNDNTLRTFVALSLLANRDRINISDVQSAWKKSQEKVREWTRT